jgi:hypothetical protein
MAVHKTSPAIVRNGLVLLLDGANPKSYAGTGTTWNDLSGNSYHGTVIGTPVYSKINAGQFTTNGSSQYVSLGNPMNSVFTGASAKFTLCYWVKITRDTADVANVTIAKYIGTPSTSTRMFWSSIRSVTSFNYGGLKAEFIYYGALDGSSHRFLRCNTTIQLNRWYNIVITYDNTINTNDGLDRVNFYINGVLDGKTMPSVQGSLPTSIPSGPGYLGVFASLGESGTLGTNTTFKGSGSHFSIYNRVLSQTEITQNYNALKARFQTPEIVSNGLVLHYDAAESYPNTGTTVIDLSNSGTNGTLTGGVGYNTTNYGQFTFDGVNDYINCGNILNYTTGNFSFSSWVYFNTLSTSNPAQGPIIFYKGTFGVNGYYIQVLTDGRIQFSTSQSGVGQSTRSDFGTITTGKWYNVCVVRNGSSAKIYVNGQEVIYNLVATHINPASSGDNFAIGAYATTLYANCKIPIFMNYNRALTDTEVLQNFNAARGRFGI